MSETTPEFGGLLATLDYSSIAPDEAAIRRYTAMTSGMTDVAKAEFGAAEMARLTKEAERKLAELQRLIELQLLSIFTPVRMRLIPGEIPLSGSRNRCGRWRPARRSANCGRFGCGSVSGHRLRAPLPEKTHEHNHTWCYPETIDGPEKQRHTIGSQTGPATYVEPSAPPAATKWAAD